MILSTHPERRPIWGHMPVDTPPNTACRHISRTLLVLVSLLCAMVAMGQGVPAASPRGDVRLVFYNLENYFAPFVDSTNLEREFSPIGNRYWHWQRFQHKTHGIYKVLVAIGQERPVELVGLCEIENRFVLHHLVNNTPMAKYPYGIVHRDSPDSRGIDVGLLYLKSAFDLIGATFYPVQLPTGRTTRDILYAKGVLQGTDTLHILVCHMPSKYGGAIASEEGRQAAALRLQAITDSILHTSAAANVVVMGDFNDTPDSPSIVHGLRASASFAYPSSDSLYNLALPWHQAGKGSIKYQGNWELIDLMFVSGTMLSPKAPLHCAARDYFIFSMPYLMESDDRNVGYKPKRTYNGFTYNGGISDHLPVVLDLHRYDTGDQTATTANVSSVLE